MTISMTMQTRRRRLGMQNPGWESWVDLARNRSLHLQPPFGMLIIIMLIKMVIVRTVMIMVKTKLENAYPFHCWWQNCQMMQDYSSLVIVAQSWFVVDVSKLTPHWFSFAFVFQQINIGFINFEGRVVSLWCQVLLWLTIIFKRQTSQFAEMVALLEWGHDWSEKKVVCKITSMWFECYKSDGGSEGGKGGLAKSPPCGLNEPQPWDWIWPQITFPTNVSKCHFFTAPRPIRPKCPIAKLDRVRPQ